MIVDVEAPLDPSAVRVLGSLIEKEVVTPDNYPLSLNALIAACNQTSNRDPVLALDERSVLRSLDELRRRSLARGMHGSDSRVTKYQHLAREAFSLNDAELAVMCVLMLRGPQTPGEIKTRTNRLFEFTDLAQVEATLEALIVRLPAAQVARLPRRPGQKDARYMHLLSGDTPAEAPLEAPEPDRLQALESAVNALRAEVVDLRAQLDEFRREFH
jgi:uncharacterized protein YceH (UPF0502 family)